MTANRPSPFLVISSVALGVVLFGFSFTYWGALFSGFEFPPLIHVHAALWFGWFGLLLGQALLISGGRKALHETLGAVIGAYTAVLIGVSSFLAISALARSADLITGGFESVQSIIPLSQILMFTAFFGAAMVRRSNPSHHRRWLMLAALVGGTPALARISIGLLGGPNVPLIFAVSSGLVIAVAVADRQRHGQFHPVYLWGGLAIILVRVVRVPVAMTPMWAEFAQQLSAR